MWLQELFNVEQEAAEMWQKRNHACPMEASRGTKASDDRVVPENNQSGIPVLPQKEMSSARSLEENWFQSPQEVHALCSVLLRVEQEAN